MLSIDVIVWVQILLVYLIIIDFKALMKNFIIFVLKVKSREESKQLINILNQF